VFTLTSKGIQDHLGADLIWVQTNGQGRGQGDEAGVKECQGAKYNPQRADVTVGMAPDEMQ
jgi:hypothetical protein